MPTALGFISSSADLAVAGDLEGWMPLPGNARTLPGVVKDHVGKSDLADPALSPPLLMTSTRDFLLSTTAIFARKLAERGVDARLVAFERLALAVWTYMPISEVDEASSLVANFLKRAWRGRRRGEKRKRGGDQRRSASGSAPGADACCIRLR